MWCWHKSAGRAAVASANERIGSRLGLGIPARDGEKLEIRLARLAADHQGMLAHVLEKSAKAKRHRLRKQPLFA